MTAADWEFLTGTAIGITPLIVILIQLARKII